MSKPGFVPGPLQSFLSWYCIQDNVSINDTVKMADLIARFLGCKKADGAGG